MSNSKKEQKNSNGVSDIMPDDLMINVLGKLYEKLTEGDPKVVKKSPDNHLAWLPVGIPFDEGDFDFLHEGFKGHPRPPKFSGLNETMDILYGKTEKEKPDSKGENDSKEKAPDQEDTEKESHEKKDAAEIRPASDYKPEELIAIDASRKYLQAENLAALLNYIPDVDSMDGSMIDIFNTEGSLTSVYDEVLNHCQVYDYEIDEKTKKKLEKFRSKMEVTEYNDILEKEQTKPSKLYNLYHEKMVEYDAAVLERAVKKAEAITGKNESSIHTYAHGAADIYNRKVNTALKDWINNGYKTEYEHISAFINHVEGQHMVSLIQKYKDDYDTAKIIAPSGSGLPFRYTSLVPGSFARSSSWTEFKFTASDFSSKFHSKSLKVKASARGGFMGFGAKVGMERKTSKRQSSIDATNFYISFKVCCVPIYRPWFHESFLTNTSWRFNQNDINYKEALLSDGGTPPKGRMPGILSQCIFIKDLKAHFGKSHSDFVSNQLNMKTKASAGYLWFGKAKASTDYNRSDSSYNRNAESQEVNVEGIQLIGFKCRLLPKSPNPNPEINKWV